MSFTLTEPFASASQIAVHRPDPDIACNEALRITMRIAKERVIEWLEGTPTSLSANFVEFWPAPGEAFIHVANSEEVKRAGSASPLIRFDSEATVGTGFKRAAIAVLPSLVSAVIIFVALEVLRLSCQALVIAGNRMTIIERLIFVSVCLILVTGVLDAGDHLFSPLQRWIVERLPSELQDYLFILVYLGFFVTIAAAVTLADVLLRVTVKQWREARNPLHSVVRAFAYAAVLASLVVGSLLLLALYPVVEDYKAPAFVWSLLLTGIAAAAFRQAFGLSVSAAVVLALFASVTIYFPSGPAYPETDSLENVMYWPRLVSVSLARILFLTGVLLFGMLLVRNRKPGIPEGQVDRPLLGVLVMSVAIFGLRSPSDAVALLTVWAIANRVLFRDAVSETSMDNRSVVENGTDSAIMQKALATGFLAAVILWVQLIATGAGRDAAEVHYMLFNSTSLFGVFATGTIAALLLYRSFYRLHGGSAVVKAFLIAVTIVALNVASNFGLVMETGNILPSATEFISVVSALLLNAIYFGVPSGSEAPVEEGSFRGLFRRATLERVVPILSGLVAAVLSAVIPIFNERIGEALVSVVEATIPQKQTSTSPGTLPAEPQTTPAVPTAEAGSGDS